MHVMCNIWVMYNAQIQHLLWIYFTKSKNFLDPQEFLEKFHFSISISRRFYFTFHFSKRVNLIFISLFTSRREWIRFKFHFSLLELSISTLAGHWSKVELKIPKAIYNVYAKTVSQKFVSKIYYSGFNVKLYLYYFSQLFGKTFSQQFLVEKKKEELWIFE